MVLNGKNIREIHKKLFDLTIKLPEASLKSAKLYAFMEKVANKTAKSVNHKKSKTENAVSIYYLFNREKLNSKSKKLINHELNENAENAKSEVIGKYLKDSRDNERWIYLASSHDDCAEDHLPYQGHLYYDEKAPENIKKWCKNRGFQTIQWVMGAPAWFITRPNCRHFFKSLTLDIVKKYSLKELTKRYKTHRMAGDKSLATPAKIAIEEYEDRLRMLKAMYNEHPTEHLRREIQKIELLIKKWKNNL